MEAITGAVALLGAILVLVTRPIQGLAVYIALLLLYPDYLRIDVGATQVSAARIVIAVLLLRCLTDSQLMGRFRWQALDTLMLAAILVGTLTLLFTTPVDRAVQYQAGLALDAFAPYLAVRLTVTDRQAFIKLAKATALSLAALALLGATEALTGRSPYNFLKGYSFRGALPDVYEERYGMARAAGSFSQPIMFGMVFATLFPLVWVLRRQPRPWNRYAYLLSGAAILGCASSLSTGPFMQFAAVIGWLALETRKRLIKPIIVLFVLGCIAIETVSNRHFYYVLAESAFDSVNGWYRARLVDVAVQKLPEYWAFGYGLMRDPGWGPEIIGLESTDTVNMFIYTACMYGLPGLAVFVGAFALPVWKLWRCTTRSPDAWLRSACWAVEGSLVGLLLAFWTVAYFGAMTNAVSIVLGSAGFLITARVPAMAPVRIPAAVAQPGQAAYPEKTA